MSGPKNDILGRWNSTALRPVELPSGMKALIVLPDLNELILRDALPANLRDLAMRYATEGITFSKLDAADMKLFIQFTRELVTRMVRYMAEPESSAWDQFRTEGGMPSDYGWQPVTLTPELLAESDVDPGDIAALSQIAGRVSTPNEITAMSRHDRGLLDDIQAAEAGQDTPGQKLDDYERFRGQPGGPDDGADSEDVRDDTVELPAGTRPRSRLRGRRSSRA